MDAETEQRAVNSIWDRVAELQRKKDEAEAERLGISYEKVAARCREFHAARGEPETIKPPRPAAQT